MECRQVQRELAASTPRERGLWLNWRIKRHLQRCPACAQARQQMRQLEKQMRHWLSDPPPEALRDRIAVAISQAVPESAVPATPAPSPGALVFSHVAESLKRLKEKQTM